MGLKSSIKNKILNRLPNKLQCTIERVYLSFFVKNYIEDEIKIFTALCNPQKASIDVGANKGIITLLLMKYSSCVYCFEPVPWLANALKEKFRDCNVIIHNCALGAVNDVMNLSVPFVNQKAIESRSSLCLDYNNEFILSDRVNQIKVIPVNVKKLDDYNLRNIGFIKIDVEGFELDVLKGATETIKNSHPNMLIEIEQRHHKTNNINDIFQYIIDLGYHGYFMLDKKISKIEEFNVREMQDQTNEKSEHYINNFIFSHYPIPSDV